MLCSNGEIKNDTSAIPQIPNISFSAVPMAPIPPIPIPALSEAASLASNEYAENQTKASNNFQFSIFEQKKMASPASSNSTFSPSSFSNTQSVISPNQSGNAIILARDQYNFLLQSLHRLTHSQQSQKETIAQLLTRINSLESRMNDQSMQQTTEQFWSSSSFVPNGNATPNSLGYSLAHDFNAMAQQTQTLSSNSSQTPPGSNLNFDFFHHQQMNDSNNANDEDGDDEMEETQQQQQNDHGMMFNDISMHFESNEFPPYI